MKIDFIGTTTGILLRKPWQLSHIHILTLNLVVIFCFAFSGVAGYYRDIHLKYDLRYTYKLLTNSL